MLALVKQKVPFYYLIILSLAFAIAVILFVPVKFALNTPANDAGTITSMPGSNNDFEIKRLSGYTYISPLLFVETKNKSERLSQLTQKAAAYIEQVKSSNVITGASFYLRAPDDAEWTGYNEEEKYNPGSMMKVPELISILKLEEEKPGFLNEKYFYQAPFIVEKKTEFTSRQLEPGKSYSVKELLRYMITYSDNNATILLDQHLDQRIFNKVLTDLHLPAPEKNATNYPVSAKDFSLFMRAIYNASYLTIAHSEYAAELLSTSDFKAGFIKGFPPATKMIHKFGEAGNQVEHQLHESGIVYINNKPYVLTIMTKGSDLKNLAPVITEIAKIVYQEVFTP